MVKLKSMIKYNGLGNVAHSIGIDIIAPKTELGVTKGVSYTISRRVALNPRNSQLQNIKTLIHELTHAKLHIATIINQYTKAEKEFEAEMVAYCVSSYFGKDIEDESVCKFKVANEIVETLSKIHKAKGLKRYDKTKFELYFDSNCTDKFYTGRVDIGDEYADNLKELIYKSIKEIHRDSNISTNHMKALFNVLDIKH